MSEQKPLVAKDENEAWEIQTLQKDKPHGWIQWKGTDICMDVQCKCGHQNHIDGYFAYHVRCSACKTVYFCNGHIELIELEKEPDNCVLEEESTT